MALSRVKNWGTEVLTDTDLEAEFDNIYNNALTLISPLTGNLAAGGNLITGLGLGSASGPSLQFTGDANTGVFSSGADIVSLAAGGVEVFFAQLSSGDTIGRFTSTSAGASGPTLQLYHNSASPADNDTPGLIRFIANDSGATSRVVGQIHMRFDDVTETEMDSTMVFSVMNAVNASDFNTAATLSSLGAWTDASDEAGKEYTGDVDDVLTKMRQLSTLGVYHGAGVPIAQKATAERHYSPTAQDFYAVFGLGVDPAKGFPGIAAKDVAWLAVKAAMELEDRVAALEAK